MRIKRNKLIETAGTCFQGLDSSAIRKITNDGGNAIFGIKRDDGVFMVVGEKFVYFGEDDCNKSKVSNLEFLNILRENALTKGKGANFEFVTINSHQSVWVMNEGVMCAIWNTLLLIYDLYGD